MRRGVRCASAERASCIELGSRQRIFKSGISSGSSDPEIGVPLWSPVATGAIGTAKEAPECERATPADRRRLAAVGRAETRGEREKDEREKEREVSSYRARRLLADNRFLERTYDRFFFVKIDDKSRSIAINYNLRHSP